MFINLYNHTTPYNRLNKNYQEIFLGEELWGAHPSGPPWPMQSILAIQMHNIFNNPYLSLLTNKISLIN
jgi:hypothetical protein